MTTVFDCISEWRRERVDQIRAGQTLGVVPTMGALHNGHVSLVRRSRAENALTLVTIFVNITQFDDPHDFAHYPRTLTEDLRRLRSEGADFVLCPSQSDLSADAYKYRVKEFGLSTMLEGAHRPDHFDAVLTVVLKILQIAAAERAYFGEKDWQQLRLVQGMARAFFLPTEIVACATVRERDGLALSSRNRRLQAADRERAPAFYRILSSAPTVHDALCELRSLGFAVDYVEERDGRRLGAVRLGTVRLIDNVGLTSTPPLTSIP